MPVGNDRKNTRRLVIPSSLALVTSMVGCMTPMNAVTDVGRTDTRRETATRTDVPDTVDTPDAVTDVFTFPTDCDGTVVDSLAYYACLSRAFPERVSCFNTQRLVGGTWLPTYSCAVRYDQAQSCAFVWTDLGEQLYVGCGPFIPCAPETVTQADASDVTEGGDGMDTGLFPATSVLCRFSECTLATSLDGGLIYNECRDLGSSLRCSQRIYADGGTLDAGCPIPG